MSNMIKCDKSGDITNADSNVLTTLSIPKFRLSSQDISYIITDTWITTTAPPDYPLRPKPLICKCCGAPMDRKDKCEYCDTKYA